MNTLRSLLLISTIIPLAACGADDIASPGDGVIVTPPTPTPTPPTPTPPTTPAGTPFQGTLPANVTAIGGTDRGVLGTNTAGVRVVELPATFRANTTLPRVQGIAYRINGQTNVGVDCGGGATNAAGCVSATLTIEPGVTLFANSGNDYLVVNRGSRISAVGTASQPIVFTAAQNMPGATDPVTDASQGLWGGIIILGRAPISQCPAGVAGGTATCDNVVEGTTGSRYGGDQPNDNSGTMQYVQIRYSGFTISANNELQGLTLGGVGQLTTLDHIHVHNSSDDGVEIFGGRVNMKYLAVTGADDDGYDTDFGYRGTLQYYLYVQKPGGTDRGNTAWEADSNDNEDLLPRQYARISNATIVQRANATTADNNGMTLRGGGDYVLANSVVTSNVSCIDIDETGGTTTRAADGPLQDLGAPVFRSVVMSCGIAAYRNDNNVAVATVQAIFGTGTNNNNDAYTPTLTNVFVNGATENAVPVTNPTVYNDDIYANGPYGAGGTAFTGQPNTAAPNRLTATTFIGAVQNTADLNANWAGWTCNSGYATFGGTSQGCTSVPTN